MDKKFIVYFMDGMVAAFRNAVLAETHSHHAVQITIDLEGEIEVFHNDTVDTFRGVIIPQGLSHRLDASGHWQLTLLLDPELTLTQQIINQVSLGDRPIPIPDQLFEKLVEWLPKKPEELESLDVFKLKFLKTLNDFLAVSIPHTIDQRVTDLIQDIHALEDLSTTDKLIDKLPLSKSRISHLFVQHTGIPLRSYIVWLKVRRSVDHMLNGHSITDSAHLAGFSDLAHLSRSFKKMFGINVSLLFQGKDFIHLETE